MRTGGGNLLTPSADPSDGLLDLCIVKELGRLEFTRLLPTLRAGEHLDDPAVIYLQAKEFRVAARHGEPLAVNADGEPVEEARTYQYAITGINLPLVIGGA